LLLLMLLLLMLLLLLLMLLLLLLLLLMHLLLLVPTAAWLGRHPGYGRHSGLSCTQFNLLFCILQESNLQVYYIIYV
jgi:hypothetical protein